MGVQGLWQLLEAVGRPVPLETLENKVLAVDVSIWLNQAVKGFRDTQGQPLHNAHLLGLFHRICKLLFYKIKPVFVFDGGVPYLKKQTLVSRQQRRCEASEKSKNAARKILSNYLMSQVLRSKNKGSTKTKSSPLKSVSSRTAERDVDLYKLPPLPSLNESEPSESEDSNAYSSQLLVEQDEFQDLDNIDPDSEDFNALPPEIRHELLLAMKEKRRRSNWARCNEMPADSQSFSSYQMSRLLHKRKIQQKIEEARTEINVRSSGDILSIYDDDKEYASAESRCIMSEDYAHYILIKGIKKKAKPLNVESKEVATANHISTDLAENHVSNEIKEKPERTSMASTSSESNSRDIRNDKRHWNDEVKLSPVVNKFDSVKPADELKLNKDYPSTYLRLEDSEASLNCDQDMDVESRKMICDDNMHSSAVDVPLPTFVDSLDSNNKQTECHAINEEGFSTPASRTSNTNAENMQGSPQIIDKPAQSVIMRTKNGKKDGVNLQDSTSEKRKVFENNAQTEKKMKLSDDSGEDLAPCSSSKTASNNKKTHTIEVTINPTSAPDDDLFPAEIFCTSSSPKSSTTSEVNDVEILLENIVKENDSNIKLTEEEISELTAELEEENYSLVQEKGRKERQALSVGEYMYQESQELLRLFGIPYVVSPMEAEAQCAQLDLLGLTQGTITDDSDIWLFGGREVYKNFFTQGKYVEKFKHTDIQAEFGLNRHKLIALAMLAGSDYTEGIEGIGPVTAMEILSEFSDPEGFESLVKFRDWMEKSKNSSQSPGNNTRAKLLKFDLIPGFPNRVIYDAYLKPEVDASCEKFTWGIPSLDSLRSFANDKLGWSQSKVDELLLPVIKKTMDSQIQLRIDSFFNPIHLQKEKNLFPSKRVQRAIKKMHGKDCNDDPQPKTDTRSLRQRSCKKSQNSKNSDSDLDCKNNNTSSTKCKKSRTKRTIGSTKGKGKSRVAPQMIPASRVVLSEDSSDTN